MTKYGKKRKKSGLPVKEQDAKVSVPVVETQARIDDRERRPPLLTKRWRERERGEGERERKKRHPRWHLRGASYESAYTGFWDGEASEDKGGKTSGRVIVVKAAG